MISFSEIVIYSVWITHVGASVISLAPTFFQESERAHFAAPPFQIEPATLGFDSGLGAGLKLKGIEEVSLP